MSRLYQWNKYSHLEVFEGEWSLIVGSEKTGYTVFANKNKKLKIYEDGNIDHDSSNMILNTYKDKREALKIFRVIEKQLNSKRDDIVSIPIDAPRNYISDAHVMSNQGKGVVIVYNPKYPEGEIHERAHIHLGHLSPKCKKGDIQKEKEAIELEIKKMKELGLYNRNARNRAIRRFATYYRGGDRAKSARVVKAIEGRIKLEKIND